MKGKKIGLRKWLGLKLFKGLYDTAVEQHELRTLFWECTLRCNLRCRHCGSDCRVDVEQRDMPLADFLRVLDEEVTPNTDPSRVLIIFSGGEVLVRPDLELAGHEVTRRGYKWASGTPLSFSFLTLSITLRRTLRTFTLPFSASALAVFVRSLESIKECEVCNV